MGIKLEEYSGTCVVTVDGDLAGDAPAILTKAVDDQIRKNKVDFVIDLEKTPFIDSEGLETLLWIKKQSENCFGVTKLANLDENCRMILEITRLGHRFETHTELAGALKTMR